MAKHKRIWKTTSTSYSKSYLDCGISALTLRFHFLVVSCASQLSQWMPLWNLHWTYPWSDTTHLKGLQWRFCLAHWKPAQQKDWCLLALDTFESKEHSWGGWAWHNKHTKAPQPKVKGKCFSDLSNMKFLLSSLVTKWPAIQGRMNWTYFKPRTMRRKVVLSSPWAVTKQFPPPPFIWVCIPVFVFLLIPVGSTGS